MESATAISPTRKTRPHGKVPISTSCKKSGSGKKSRYGTGIPWLFLGVLVLALAAYLPILGNELVGDDTGIILGNENMGDLDRFLDLFTQNYWGEFTARGSLWRPVSLVSFGLDVLWFGINPFFLHMTNMMLHAVASLLFLVVARRWLPWKGAFLAGAVFAVHPIHVEAVAGVVGRCEILSSLFCLAALLCHQNRWRIKRYSRQGSRGPGILLAAVFTFLAIGAKESAFLFPLILLVADVIDRRKRGTSISLRPYAVYALVCVVYLGLRQAVLGPNMFGDPLDTYTAENQLWWVSTQTRVFTAIKLLGFYLWLLIFPVFLSVDYSFNAIPAVSGMGDARFLLSMGVLGAWLATGVVSLIRGRGVLAISFALFLAPLLIISNLFFPIGTIFAERFLYLPVAGIALAAGGLFVFLTGRSRIGAQAPGKTTIRDWLPPILVAGLLVLLGGKALMRDFDWRSDETLFRSAARICPDSAKARFNLGNALVRADKLREAIQAYKSALSIKPDYLAAHINLGRILQRTGLLGKAEDHFRDGVRIAPDHGGALFHLGSHLLHVAKQASPKSREAVLVLHRAMACYDSQKDRSSVALAGAITCRQVLSRALYQNGNAEEGLRILKEARDLAPGDPLIQASLIRRLIRDCKLKEAEETLERLPTDHPVSDRRKLVQMLEHAQRAAR